ncbi:MAG: thiamine diphosphokinase [Eubacteriales bacterium]|nr:thiamine diphosphokinase [Lachnospiraceae bacterium]MDO5127615.1 thiamine diphosphokinase [Eubacteriales bacterium]
MNKDTVVVVTGGTVEESVLSMLMGQYKGAYVIGVDRGLDTLEKFKIKPDLAVGDFDSASEQTKIAYENFEHVIKLNPMKDYTDTHVAVEQALLRRPSQIILVGATGTRFDHMQGNLALLKLCRMSGIEAVIYDSHNKIRMIDRMLTLYKKTQYGKYISLIPYSDTVKGINLTGFLYNLQDATMIKEETLGISNEMREEECRITIEDGYLLVMETKD